jgi:hypothetical protein
MQRLHDHSGYAIAGLVQNARERIGAFNVARVTLQADRTAMAIRGVCAPHRKTHRAEGGREKRIVADGHRPGGITVIAVLERHDFAFFAAAGIAPELHGHFERDLDGGGPVIREKYLRELGGKDAAQFVGKRFDRFVRESSEKHVLQAGRLLRNRSRDARVRVAVKIHPPRRDRVENATAVFGVKTGTFAAHDFHRRRIEVWARKRMPDLQRGLCGGLHACAAPLNAPASKCFEKTSSSVARSMRPRRGISPITRVLP